MIFFTLVHIILDQDFLTPLDMETFKKWLVNAQDVVENVNASFG
jgi:hypothetical protein